MKLSSLTSVAAVLAATVAVPVHAENPFTTKAVSAMTLASNHADHEGKCGEGKCGGAMKTETKAKEGKCGEGKCGGTKTSTVSKEEFMKKHDAMFDKADTNKDGMLDAKEHKALHRDMKKHMKAHEGKCGEGKCGSAK